MDNLRESINYSKKCNKIKFSQIEEANSFKRQNKLTFFLIFLLSFYFIIKNCKNNILPCFMHNIKY